MILAMKLESYVIGFILRIGFVFYGIFHDKINEVKYTDIDYSVFTGAANYVVQGESPYLEPTYKYTPLLAFLLTPNILLHNLFGKILFCVMDILVIIVMEKILERMGNCTPTFSSKLINSFWMLNPFTMTISSRGNAESVQILLVLLLLLTVMNGKHMLAGFFFGLAVHFKLYPIIYILPILLYIGNKSTDGLFSKGNYVKSIVGIVYSIFSFQCILFGLISLFTFLILAMMMYWLYAMDFIENTYLFHFTRKDLQHNFSPYFFILRIAEESKWGVLIKSLAFLPQLIAVVWFGIHYFKQLPLACFLQTFAFVALNKVCTSQYFVWYIGLLPLAAPYLRISLKRASIMISAWLGGQAVWLALAYLLEFRKLDVVLYVWFASLLFLLINMVISYQLITLAIDPTSETPMQTDKKKK